MYSVLTARGILVVGLIIGSSNVAAAEPRSKPEAKPRTRSFLFTYSATLTDLTPGKETRIWLPVPPSNEDQTVRIESKDAPGEVKIAREPKYGNQILYIEGKPSSDGMLSINVTYRVTRREVRGDVVPMADPQDDLSLFLKPNSRVPIEGKPLELIKSKEIPKDQMEAARLFYDTVNAHMRYSKEGTGWGQGDSVWACTSGRGNCSDFHSLFMSLARAQKIPTKFEIGFPLPEKHGAGAIAGYHCWAKFHAAGKGWIPVDISEANKNPKLHDYYFGNLTENRVTFSTGRDIDLIPKQAGPALNFFIYPYVEVDGKPCPSDKISSKFSYQDSPAEAGN